MTRSRSSRRQQGTSPTLDEVARHAGVSRATASRAINGGHLVSPATRAAVEDAVRALGYTPNAAARSLVTRRTGTVAVVVPDPVDATDPQFVRVLRAVTRVLEDARAVPALFLSRPGREDEIVGHLRHRHLDGALVVAHHRDSLADQLGDLGLPCAFVGRPWSDEERVAHVDCDHVVGGADAARHLLESGRRRIAHLAGPDDVPASADRMAGWRIAMESAGLPDDAVLPTDLTEEGGAAATATLLARHPDIDGIVAGSDPAAVGALRALAAAGRRVPEDVAVVGYGDLGLAERADPPLTTVRVPLDQMATQATQLLLAQIDDGYASPVRVVYPPLLVRRASG